MTSRSPPAPAPAPPLSPAAPLALTVALPQVGRAVTLHGHGFLPLSLPDVAPLTGTVYSGFGFRSTQDSALLYHRASPVR